MSAPEPGSVPENEVFKALAHPVRRLFLRTLLNGQTALSPIAFHRQTGTPLPNSSYHVGVLSTLGIIEVVQKIPRRGAVENMYRVSGRNGPAATGLLATVEAFQNDESPPPPEG